MKKNTLIVIAGPTAVGKTKLSVELAKHFQTVVLSADSRQFYKELSIGTAKPSANEMEGIQHYFIDNLSIADAYNVGQYEQEVISLLDELFVYHNCVILCGGSGLFIDAVCKGLDAFENTNETIKNDIRQSYLLHGLSWLQEMVKKHDPEYFNTVDQQNPQRLMRALEVCLSSGKPYSSFRTGASKERNFHCLKILLNCERPILYERINKRVDAMIEEGLLEEAKSVASFKNHNALRTVGYKEIFDFLDGIQNWETSRELIKQNTRHFAKRQLTWFKKNNDYTVFNPQATTDIIAFIETQLANQ